MKSAESHHTTKPSAHPHGWQQDDSALIPRERSLLIAWWIAIVLAVVFIVGAAVFKPDPYWEIIQFIGDGLVVTFQITIVSMTFALLLGLIAGLGRTATNSFFNTLASLYVEVIRGIPLLAQLFWIYYAMSRFIRLGPQVSAVLGLTICYGAYIGETFRGGIQSIPKGQVHSAYALGLTYGQTMGLVILPQAFRNMLPVLLTQTIVLFQDTSLVYVISATDFVGAAAKIAQRDSRLVEMYLFVALVYFLLCYTLSSLVRQLQKRLAVGR